MTSETRQGAEDIANRLEESDPETCPSQREAADAIHAILAELDQVEATLALCASDTTAADLAQDVEFLKAEKADLEHSRDAWKVKAIAAEARLAKVPALVEAAKALAIPQRDFYRLREALAEWERE